MDLKQVLIISPYFPPCNAADMQRVRMSLPYFADNGWEAEVVMVDPAYADINIDEILLESVPPDVKIHQVKALNKQRTVRFGLGSIALRSLWYYRKKVNALLRTKKYDLIYFSTTQFPVCTLGPYWKRRFHVPYVIDMQDPWHSDYYRNKPKAQQPKKYWFSYWLNKFLEPIAVKNTDGLISVSESYITDLKNRYPAISAVPGCTITFGAFDLDMEIAARNYQNSENLLDKHCINVVYIGRGGIDMHKSVSPLFSELKDGLKNQESPYKKLKLYFIGTSYAPAGQGVPTIAPLAKLFDVDQHVVEITDRLSYYQTLKTLQRADALFIPGSDDPRYTASKIYPYLLTYKPLLAIFNPLSPAIKVLKEYGVTSVYDYEQVSNAQLKDFLVGLVSKKLTKQELNPLAVHKYSARQMTSKQCEFFDYIISGKD